ncbi:hypothetical protein [Paracoccus luteus]|uniref:hypothetical protein n=1 Tax=Paracoccus luteus TaxID=2508543 RepID=UPI00106F939F|nr:hypothetical protein [Paracoccus luteus]
MSHMTNTFHAPQGIDKTEKCGVTPDTGPTLYNREVGDVERRDLNLMCSLPSAVQQRGNSKFALWSEKEAAAILNMSSRKLAELRKAGEIGFMKTPTIQYWEQHLLDYLARCEVKAGQQLTARFGYRAAGIHSDCNYNALADVV